MSEDRPPTVRRHYGKVTRANTPKAGFTDSNPQITTSAKLRRTEEEEEGWKGENGRAENRRRDGGSVETERAPSFEGQMTAKTAGWGVWGGGVVDRDNMAKSHGYFSFTLLCIHA